MHFARFVVCYQIFLQPLIAAQAAQINYTPYSEARPILEAFGDQAPEPLRVVPPEKRVEAWNEWMKLRNKEIRERLAQGDADSVINLLMFGTSFTKEPRLATASLAVITDTANNSANPKVASALRSIFEKRVRDLVRSMGASHMSERISFARATLQRAGVNPTGPGRNDAQGYLRANAMRVLREQTRFQEALAEARRLQDPTDEFAQRSTLYAERGLSLDTSLPPNYAIEIALAEMKARGLLRPNSVRRIGIIGPGLDFSDKQEGFDFYDIQTLQPFAVMDSLLRLGLARRGTLEVDALDISPRVLDHVELARHSALQGQGYKIQLPRDASRRWTRQLVAYWKRFGNQIGSLATPVAVPPGLQGLALHAVRVRPEFVKRMRSLDVNIVLQREDAPDDAKFDLLIATNILVYYDTFEQCLALKNIESMLRPGGFLLTNNLLLELPSSKMKSVDYVSVEYSSREADGDRIIWYRRDN